SQGLQRCRCRVLDPSRSSIAFGSLRSCHAQAGCFIRSNGGRLFGRQHSSLKNCMKRSLPGFARLTGLAVLAGGSGGATLAANAKKQTLNEPVDFSSQIRPLISSKCFSCHGPDESSRKAKLRLDLRDEAVKDHKGTRAIVPGDPAGSELVRR